jgi:DNA-binding XRE family transcriptional regulator
MRVRAYNDVVATAYGQRFRQMRDRAGYGQERAAALLKVQKERGSSVSNIENRTKYAPRPKTVTKHAKALNCQPWELLRGVLTVVDALRSPDAEAAAAFEVVLEAWPVLSPQTRALIADTAQRVLDLQGDRPIVVTTPASQSRAKRSDRRAKRA